MSSLSLYLSFPKFIKIYTYSDKENTLEYLFINLIHSFKMFSYFSLLAIYSNKDDTITEWLIIFV